MRTLSEIARDITANWPRPYFGAVPYLDAMHTLSGMGDMYGEDDAPSVVRYFLSNATQWRGDKAREVKAELKNMLKGGCMSPIERVIFDLLAASADNYKNRHALRDIQREKPPPTYEQAHVQMENDLANRARAEREHARLFSRTHGS